MIRFIDATMLAAPRETAALFAVLSMMASLHLSTAVAADEAQAALSAPDRGLRELLNSSDTWFRNAIGATDDRGNPTNQTDTVREMQRKLLAILLMAAPIETERMATDDVLCLAEIADRLRMWGVSRQYADAVIERDSRRVEAHILRVRALLNMKEIDVALSAISEACVDCPDYAQLYVLHYFAYRKCRHLNRPERIDQVTLFFDRCSERLRDDSAAPRMMAESVDYLCEEYRGIGAGDVLDSLIREHRDRARRVILDSAGGVGAELDFGHSCDVHSLVCRLGILAQDDQICDDVVQWLLRIEKEVVNRGASATGSYEWLRAIHFIESNLGPVGDCIQVRRIVERMLVVCERNGRKDRSSSEIAMSCERFLRKGNAPIEGDLFGR